MESHQDLLVGEALQLDDAPAEVELPADALIVFRLTPAGKGKLELQTRRRHVRILRSVGEYALLDRRRKLLTKQDLAGAVLTNRGS